VLSFHFGSAYNDVLDIWKTVIEVLIYYRITSVCL